MKRYCQKQAKNQPCIFLTHTVQMKLDYELDDDYAYITFLTHTVQMKQYLADEDTLLVEYLLNPHGSDETSTILYTCAMYVCFLTHTVQMKRIQYG